MILNANCCSVRFTMCKSMSRNQSTLISVNTLTYTPACVTVMKSVNLNLHVPCWFKRLHSFLIKAPCVLTKLPWWKHLHCLYSVIKEPSILSMLFQSCPAFLIWASILNSTLLNTVVRQTSWLFICVWNENSNVPNAFAFLKMGLFFLRGH